MPKNAIPVKAAAFQTSNRHSRQPEQERIERLEKKIQTNAG